MWILTPNFRLCHTAVYTFLWVSTALKSFCFVKCFNRSIEIIKTNPMSWFWLSSMQWAPLSKDILINDSNNFHNALWVWKRCFTQGTWETRMLRRNWSPSFTMRRYLFQVARVGRGFSRKRSSAAFQGDRCNLNPSSASVLSFASVRHLRPFLAHCPAGLYTQLRVMKIMHFSEKLVYENVLFPSTETK